MSIDVSTFVIDPIGTGAHDASMTGKEVINDRLAVIQDDLNTLARRIAQTTGKSAIVQQYAPLSEDVSTGDMVYFDPDTKLYTPALAQLRAIPGVEGQSLEAPCSRVEGVVLSTYSDSSNNVVGTLLLGGTWQDDNDAGLPVLTGCLGVNARIPGVYYLSAENAGKCTNDPGIHLRQPVLSNHGDGSFSLNIFYMAHDNHFHGSCVLHSTWVSVETTLPDGVEEEPEGAKWWYDGSADQDFIGIGGFSSEVTAIFYGGTLQGATSDFVIADGYIWYKGNTKPVTDMTTVFNHYPFSYGSPVVRTVESVNDAITVSTINGRAVIQANAFKTGSTQYNATALSGINGNTLQYTPVVSGLAAGPGIRVDGAVNGVVTVSSSNNVNVPLDAYSVYHKGTNVVCDDAFIYIAFPVNRASAYVMNMPVSNVGSATTLRAFAYCCGVGTGATFDVTLYWAPQPTAANTTVLSRTPVAETTLSLASGDSETITYAETPVGAEITGEGVLTAMIAVQNAPNEELRIIRTGFRLEVVASATATTHLEDVTNINAVINTMTAGATLTKYTCVRAVNGVLQPCTSANAASLNQCIGVVIDAGSQGDALRYLIQGVIEDSSFAFTPGAPLFLSPTGTITEVNPADDPSAAYICRIGTALTATIIQISVGTSILKG